MNRYSFGADYFSFGCLLYELLSLKNPFYNEKGTFVFSNQTDVFFLFIIIINLFINNAFISYYKYNYNNLYKGDI
jgi:serine/threonine protein kinase